MIPDFVKEFRSNVHFAVAEKIRSAFEFGGSLGAPNEVTEHGGHVAEFLALTALARAPLGGHIHETALPDVEQAALGAVETVG